MSDTEHKNTFARNSEFSSAFEKDLDKDGWSIELRAHSAAGIATHFEIAFRLPNGKIFKALNGDPYDRDTGQRVESFDNDHTLRVSTGFYKGNDPDIIPVFSGTGREVMQKFGQALETGVIINGQNLEYRAFGLGEPGQNSNSVVATLLKAMGLKFPPAAEAYNAPGSERILLPASWQPSYDFSHDSQYRIHNIKENHWLLEPENVSKQVLKDPRPEKTPRSPGPLNEDKRSDAPDENRDKDNTQLAGAQLSTTAAVSPPFRAG